MKLIHTADWHLGKRLNGFLLDAEQREALAALLVVVDRESPDVMLLAGDVFDTPVPPLSALETWSWFVNELVAERGVPLVAIPGNHDHPERLAVNARVARRSGLHILHDLRECHLAVRVAGIEIFGVPFHKPAHVRTAFPEEPGGVDGERGREPGALPDWDPNASYDLAMDRVLQRVRAAFAGDGPSVLMGHAFVEGGGEEPDGEDAIAVGGAGTVRVATLAGFDYVALGHIHGARDLVRSGPPVRYAGSIYPYSFSEAGRAKSVDVVTFEDGATSVRRAPIEVRRRVRLIEDVTFEQVLDEAATVPQDERHDYVLVRVTDRGPIDHAVARLREFYPNALLQQPAIEVTAEGIGFDGDAHTVGTEEAFRAFYRHVYQVDMSPLEDDLLREVLNEDDGNDVDYADDERANDDPAADDHSDDAAADETTGRAASAAGDGSVQA
ncbi:MAG: exonuclease SbcCD subunit D [Trueperaceae bacterium]